MDKLFDFNHENNQEKHEEIIVDYFFETIPSEKHPERNEDTVLVDANHQAFGVFDGVGGAPGGDFASQTARDFVLTHINEIKKGMNIDEAKEKLKEIFIRADEEVNQTSKILPEYEDMSTTGSVLKIHTDNNGKHYALIANIGDSRIYKIDKDGVLQQVTLDDSLLNKFVTDKDKKQIIDKKISNIRTLQDLSEDDEVREYFFKRNHITKWIGSKNNNELNVDVISIEKGDRFLITSDGIHDNLTTSEIQEVVNNRLTPNEIVSNLKNKSLLRSREPSKNEIRAKRDDMSAVFVEIK